MDVESSRGDPAYFALPDGSPGSSLFVTLARTDLDARSVAAGAWTQAGYDIRFDWGAAGAADAAAHGTLVVVDVLLFTTAVGVAVEQGTIVHPAPPRCRGRAARRGGRRRARGRPPRGDREPPRSLRPRAAGGTGAFAPGLPSPNGSAIAAVAAAAPTVVAGSLRNARALGAGSRAPGAGHGDRRGRALAGGVVAAGLGGSARRGAVLAALGGSGQSPEAAAAATAFEATRSVADGLRGCASGLELIEAGFGDDVEVAVEAAASEVVPVLVDGAFRAG